MDSDQQTGNLTVDAAAMRGVADRFDAAAELLDTTVRTSLSRLAFGAVSAGRAHADGGAAVADALRRWAAAVTGWSRASAEIAAALRAGVRGYTDTDFAAGARVG